MKGEGMLDVKRGRTRSYKEAVLTTKVSPRNENN